MVKTGFMFIGGVWRTAKQDSTGYCSSTVYCLTRSSLHELLFIHRRLPPASTYYYSSTIDLLQPPRGIVHPWSTVHASSTDYCSTSPPLGPVHPPPTGSGVAASSIGVLFIQRQRPTTTTTGSCSSIPQQRSLFIKRQVRSASVSSSSKGIAQIQLTAKGSIGQVQ